MRYFGFFFLLGCELFDSKTECKKDAETMWVSGRWTFSGTGTRVSCEDEKYNTGEAPFELNSDPIEVTQAANGELQLVYQHSSFSFTNALVQGCCVSFSTTEDIVGVGLAEHRWEGTAFQDDWDDSEGWITGTFTGYGPSSCQVEGVFRIDIELDPRPIEEVSDTGGESTSLLDAF